MLDHFSLTEQVHFPLKKCTHSILLDRVVSKSAINHEEIPSRVVEMLESDSFSRNRPLLHFRQMLTQDVPMGSVGAAGVAWCVVIERD